MGDIKISKKASLDKANGNILNLEDKYESNLPSPKDLESYENVLPGLAKDIVEMAKKEQNFRHIHIPKMLNKFFILSVLGMIFSVVTLFAILYFSYLLIEKGQTTQGIALILGNIVIISGAYIWIKPQKDASQLGAKKKK